MGEGWGQGNFHRKTVSFKFTSFHIIVGSSYNSQSRIIKAQILISHTERSWKIAAIKQITFHKEKEPYYISHRQNMEIHNLETSISVLLLVPVTHRKELNETSSLQRHERAISEQSYNIIALGGQMM